MPKKIIAVMGATGHIGTALTRALLAKGHDVCALGRDPAKLAALAARGDLDRGLRAGICRGLPGVRGRSTDARDVKRTPSVG